MKALNRQSACTNTFKEFIKAVNEWYLITNIFINIDEVEKLLKVHTEDFYGPIDNIGKTALHLACEKDSYQIAQLVIHHLFDGEETKAQSLCSSNKNTSRTKFINEINRDKITALHYASFKGNIRIIKYLISLGADTYAQDNDENNVMHFAAQGNQVASLFFFWQNYNFNFEMKNICQSTPLHWAAYLNYEIMLSFLIAWGANINCTDKEGNTPLHLSVMISERMRDLRCVKILLMRGADRNMVNDSKMRPIDLVQSGDMHDDLITILKNPNFCTCFMVTLPLTKINKSWKTAIFFFIAITVINALCALLVIPLTKDYKQYAIIIASSLMILTLIVFFCGCIINPGFIKPDPKLDFQELLSKVDPYNICPDCRIIRTPRSRHCNICNKCIERFDHHCPYINNCVGYRNHCLFLLFIFMLSLDLMFHLSIIIYAFITSNPSGDCWEFMKDYYPNYCYYVYSGI